MSSTPEMRRELARLYEDLPTFDLAAMPAYLQFKREVNLQFHLLLAMGVEVTWNPKQNFVPSKKMFRDLDVNYAMEVFTGGEEHQTLGITNFRFRAVHDYFGHYVGRNNFTADGEECAWEQHSKMFSPLARRAMTSETRGQNSWFNYAPCNINLKPCDRKFAEQKTALLPTWASELNS